MDSASRQIGAGVDLQLKAPTGEMIEQAIRLDFLASNNETEYKVVLTGIDLANSVSSEKLIISSDSQLVVGQVNGEYETQDQRMVRYASLVKQRLESFAAWKLEHIPRDLNEKAYALAVVAASLLIIETIFLLVYLQPTSSITTNQVNKIDEAYSSWMTPIVHYLISGELPYNRIEAHKIHVQAARFSLVNGQLYKRSLDESYLKCLTSQQGLYVLVELHEGICENHPSGRTLAHKAHMQGYYWSTMRADVAAYVRKCDRCQRQAPISRLSAQDLTAITSPWPFSQ